MAKYNQDIRSIQLHEFVIMPNHIHERRGGFHIRPIHIRKNDTGAEMDSAPTHYNFLVFYDKVSGVRY